MFRLSKYELRKNRTALFVLLAGLAALQICFLIALRGKTQDYAIIWSTILVLYAVCLLYTSPSPRDSTSSRMPSSA